MSKNDECVSESDPLDRVHRVMSDKQVRRVPVVNDRDEIVGIVALADMATEGARRGDQEVKLADTVEEISETKREHR